MLLVCYVGFFTAPAAAVSSVLRCGPRLLQCCCGSSRHSVYSELPRHHYPNHCVFTSVEHTHASLCVFSVGSLFATVVAFFPTLNDHAVPLTTHGCSKPLLVDHQALQRGIMCDYFTVNAHYNDYDHNYCQFSTTLVYFIIS